MSKALHHKTALIYSSLLSKQLAKNIFLKMECYQPCGSFKIRGIGKLCQHYQKQGLQRLVASSGGNAGMAVAYAAAKLGMSADIFVPTTTKTAAITQMRALDANIHVVGSEWNSAHAAAMEYLQQYPAGYVHPFDHPLIWSGHSTIIREASQQMDKPDVIVCAVGGGGLLSGLLQGMHAYGWQDVPMIAAETIGADSFASAMKQKARVSLDQITSICATLGAKQVCEQAFHWSQRHPITSLTVADEQAVSAAREFLDDHRVLVEPACGAALSVLYSEKRILNDYQNIVVIVCGGAGIDLAGLNGAI